MNVIVELIDDQFGVQILFFNRIAQKESKSAPDEPASH